MTTTTTTDDASPAQASTLPTRQPETTVTRPAEPPGYDVGSVWQLLDKSCDLPAAERDLLKVLDEYRAALHALATHVEATQRGQQLPEPGSPPCHASAGATTRDGRP